LAVITARLEAAPFQNVRAKAVLIHLVLKL